MSIDPVQNPYTSPSDTGTDSGTIQASAATNTIISLALVMGISVITGIMLFLAVPKAESVADMLIVDEDDYIYLGMGYGMCVVCLIAGVVMRRIYRKTAEHKFLAEHKDAKMPSNTATFPGSLHLLGSYATANIVGAALLEGPAVVNAIFLLLGENLWHLLPIAIAAFGILITLPTASRTRRFVEDIVSQS